MAGKGRPFQKGHRKLGGRRKGTPNRATRAWKDFVTALVSDPDNQQALAEAISERPELLFRAAEHAHGKPHQALDVDQDSVTEIVYRWASEE